MNNRRLPALLLAFTLFLAGLAGFSEERGDEIYSEAIEPMAGEALDFGDTGLTGEDGYVLGGEWIAEEDDEGVVLAAVGAEVEDQLPPGLEIDYEDVAPGLADGDASQPGYAVLASPADDFVVENGVLVKYNGAGGDVAIPGDLGIVEIGEDVFDGRYTCYGSEETSGICIDSIVVPEGVERLADNAFSGLGFLKAVTLPNSLKSVGQDVFSSCNMLESIVIPGSIRELPEYLFRGCDSLKRVEITGKVGKINEFMCYECEALKTISITGTVEEIGNRAFSSLPALGEVKISGSVRTIGPHAFAWCPKLEQVTLPESLEAIEDCAFYECAMLHTIALPKGLKRIGNHAFFGTRDLLCKVDYNSYAMRCCVAADLDIKVVSGEDRPLYVVEGGVLTECNVPAGGVVIPADLGIIAIGDGAFRMRSDITAVELPKGLKRIGKGAFEGCYRLASVALPEGLETVGENAFLDCRALTQLDLPEGLKSVGRDAFMGTSLDEVILPATLKQGKYAAFEPSVLLYVYDKSPACKKMKAFENAFRVLDSDLEFVLDGDTLVKYVGAAKKVTVPKGVKTVGQYAFAHASQLKKVTLPAGVKTIEAGAFKDCPSLSKVSLPEGLKTIKDRAFAGCTALKRVRLPATLKNVDDYVFEVENMVFEVYAGSPMVDRLRNSFAYWLADYQIEVIGEEAPEEPEEEHREEFEVQDSVLVRYNGQGGDVVIPESLGIVAIDRYAFSESEGVTSITIPSTAVRIIGDADDAVEEDYYDEYEDYHTSVTKSTIEMPSTLREFKVAADNPRFYARNGILYLKDLDIIVRCPCGYKGALDIAGERYYVNAFEDCDALTSIRFTVENIVAYRGGWCIYPIEDTFGSCTKLESIEITQSDTFFSYDGVAYSRMAYSDNFYELELCPPAKKGALTVPESVDSLHMWSGFHSASGFFGEMTDYSPITTVKVSSVMPYAGGLDYCDGLDLPDLVSFEVPKGNPYIKAVDGVIYSKDGKTLLRCPHGKAGVFTVPKGVTTIGKGAFSYCRKLEKIVIPDTVKTIDMIAFGECTGLKELVIPKSVKSIARCAFNTDSTSDEGEGDYTLNCPVSVYDGSAAHNYCQRVGVPYLVIGPEKGLTLKKLTVGDGSPIYPGDSVTISAKASNAGGAVRYTFKLYREGKLYKSLSRGDSTLTLTPARIGQYAVEATARDASGQKSGALTCSFSVLEVPDITGVKISKTALTLAEGKSATLTASAVSKTVKDKSVVWSSSDPAVAKVSQKGKITAKKAGEATITAASTVYGAKYATCVVTVVSKYKISKTGDNGTVKLDLGGRLQLNASFAASKGWKVKSWKSGNKKVATVSSKGLVKAKKVGSTTVTVKTKNGKKATLKIKVVDPSIPTKVKLNKTGTQKLKKGKTLKLKATVLPETADSKVTWKSSDKKIATVDKKGKVKAVKAGTVTITVKTGNSKKAKLKIKVIE